MAEKEYIEREAALKRNYFSESKTPDDNYRFNAEIKFCISSLPAADVAPVKHGHWIYQSSRKYINTDINEEKLQKEILGYGGRVILNLQCSVCRKVTMVCNSISYEYCPHCGAKMDG